MTSQGAAKISKSSPTFNSTLFRILSRVPQFTRMSRHFFALAKHSTFRKISNLILVEIEFRLRRTRVIGHPYIVIVDPMNICNLRCPLCPTGLEKLDRKQQPMSWAIFTRTVDQVAPYAYEINLHNWGEPLLHPQIFEMIEYINKRNISTNMSTNFNIVSDEKIDKLIASGLEYLILSIDGITQESYSKYRVRGDVDKVLENVSRLVRRRREQGSTTPYIEWQFIVFRHNMHELDRARKLAEEIGVDRFRVIPPGLPFGVREAEDLKRQWFIPSFDENGNETGVESFRDQIDSSCFYLYRSITVNTDGGTAPCCIVYGEQDDFGDITKQNLKNIWNSEKYKSARSLFREKGKCTVNMACSRCNLFKHKTSAPRQET